LLGVTRQTLSGELNALESEGDDCVGYGSIGIVSFEALERCGMGG
jgi:hypothetical protein